MDCEDLAESITNQTGSRISSSTLKRLFAFNKGVERPRLFTLDTIARYLGYPNWDHLDAAHVECDSDSVMNEAVDYSTLKEGDKVTVKYWPGRTLVISFLGGSMFQVMETNSPKLLSGDLLEIHSLLRKHPLVCKKVIRNEVSIGEYIGGKKDGIMYIITTNQQVIQQQQA